MNKVKLPSEVIVSLGNRKRRLPLNYLLLTILLSLMAIGGIARDLAHGYRTWIETPRIGNMQFMNGLRNSGLTLDGLKTLDHRQIRLGEGKWSAQILERPDGSRITLLLNPQDYYKNQPEVEWSDIASLARWKTSRGKDLTFTTPSSANVSARFFRAWQTSTFAVVQWYAWLGGGHHDTSVWYWSDQLARLKGKRVPWIAVSLHIPLEPTKDLETIRPPARELATRIQERLEVTVLSELTTPARKKRD